LSETSLIKDSKERDKVYLATLVVFFRTSSKILGEKSQV